MLEAHHMAQAGDNGSELSTRFIEKINNRESVIAVVGLGYVGLPLVMGFNAIGFNVLGVDIDEKKIESLNNSKSYIAHFSDEQVARMVATKRFEATTDFARLSEADAILLCVPTPLDHHREPDLSFVVETTRSIAPHIGKGQIVILESTTYPGTTREVLQPILEKGSGLVAGTDFIVAYSPEREDPGNPDFETTTIPKVVGAETADGQAMAVALYNALVPNVVKVSSPEAAEAVKLTENIFRAVNIALVNELKLIFDDMGIDVWEVIDAAATKPFGFMPFYPGPGLGGHCIPIDPFYLTWKAREFGRHTRFIELAGEINMAMPNHVVDKLADALNSQQKKALNGARILVVGVAYKKNVADMRESPSLVLIELLQKKGAIVEYYDPHIPEIMPTREHANLTNMASIEWSAEKLGDFDAVLIATNHDSIDWKFLIDHSELIIDSRNALREWSSEFPDKIFKA